MSVRPHIDHPTDRDFVVLDVRAFEKDGDSPNLTWRLIDKGDPQQTFSAMERTTAFPTAVIAHLIACKQIKPGAHPIEKCVPLDLFFSALEKRGIQLEEIQHEN